jgi:hypothetical protein
LNLERPGVVVKQALPYVRLVGESWPLPLKRSFFEYHALTRQEARAGVGTVPAIYHFDEAQALIVMEYLSPHVILRRALIDGRMLPKIGRDLGLFAARTLFRGSDLSMPARERKRDLALFADNVELCDITENLVFTDPYFEAELNRHTTRSSTPGRRTARRPRPEGRGAAAQAHVRGQGRDACCMATCTPARSWSPTTTPASSIPNSPSTGRWPSMSACCSPISG